ncbi:MAG: 16S rRNA (cytosine(1402)-N(4))-methyltransferase RsmH, partial [Candidatus Wildermuthbacteria bacterium]|nr:16S rRNA (cytosine(1402)-N(4))-methyltransferase RsmH [Candidatus Wildermuthbacteria bacterium]
RIVLVNDNFANLGEIVKNAGFNRVNGILFDLGISSWDLEGSGRGFSFLKNEPLDMRYGSQNQLTAGKIVNYWSAKDLERILTEYGEERFSREIAAGIISFRQVKPIETTLQMVEIVRKAIPYKYQRQKINPATLTFQALRIAVNDELNNLKNALPQALEILKSGGRIAVISFHSLEDRIVKTFFRDKSKEGLLNILTKKPITPSFEELRSNPRSRSAKLRAVIKI